MLTINRAPVSGLFGSWDARPPQVLAHRQPNLLSTDLDHRARVSRREVALLVEDAVVGEVHLAVDRKHSPTAEHRRRVIDLPRLLREPDDGDDPLDISRKLAQRVRRVLQKVLAQQQILGRVAGERELGEQHELRALRLRGGYARTNAPRITGDVADSRVQLAERQAHYGLAAALPVATARGAARFVVLAREGRRLAFGGLAARESRRIARSSSCAIVSRSGSAS